MIIDLRSDTVTKPSKAMLEYMCNAEVGDDVFNEDPTVIKLEQRCAQMFGMQSGLFCPSGTMTNQIALKTHLNPGDEVICDATSHIYHYETGGIGMNSGAQAKLIYGENGLIQPNQIEAGINPEYDWLTVTKLVAIENTGNKSGGNYYTFNQMKAIHEVCKKNALQLHLDGARIFNAVTETKDNIQEYGKIFSSISVCLSKGLGAPVGSVLLGDTAFIKKARRFRKGFGGGMRQAGYIAAAGLYALENNVIRLKEDHLRAKKIEQLLNNCNYVESILPVKTNIVIFKLKTYTDTLFLKKLEEQGVRATAFGKNTIRFVTHLDFNDEMLSKTEKTLSSLNH